MSEVIEMDTETYQPPEELLSLCLHRDAQFNAFVAEHDPENNYTSASEVGMLFLMGLGCDPLRDAGLVPVLTWEEEKRFNQELRTNLLDLGVGGEAEDRQEIAGVFATAIIKYLGFARGSLDFPMGESFDNRKYAPGDLLESSVMHWRDLLTDCQLQEVSKYLREEAYSWVHPDKQGWFILEGFGEEE